MQNDTRTFVAEMQGIVRRLRTMAADTCGAMTGQERLDLCNKFEARREYLLVLAVRSPRTANVWRGFADRDPARIVNLRAGLNGAFANG